MTLSARGYSNWKKARLLAGALSVLALALPGAAGAATVGVTEVLETQHTATLTYTAAPGETNSVKVTQAPLGNELLDLEVVDLGAPLNAGGGCSGGGPAGAPAHCTIHAPRRPDQVYCGKLCIQDAPGTGWTDHIAADLGDGADSFDASTLGGDNWYETFRMEVVGGLGGDVIHTGTGRDTIEPGMGNDQVDSGRSGYDTIVAEAVADGDDAFTMGNEIEDWVSYSRRATPLTMREGAIGAEGEHDTLVGVVELSSGSGADRLEPQSSRYLTLYAGAGDDVVTGGPGPEAVYGGQGEDRIATNGGDDWLSGGIGDDFLDGGAGNDRLREGSEPVEPRRFSDVPATGNDTGVGGEGDDDIQLGEGADRAEGGVGNDAIWTGAGDDFLAGGAGDDSLAGEGGADAILGGEGDDEVKAGRLDEWLKFPPRVIDTWADAIDCGPGSDEAELNRWDAARECERKKLLAFARYGKTERNRARGTAKLAIKVAGVGRLTVRGHGIAPVTARAHKIWKQGNASALVTVRARGRAAKALRAKGRVKVRIWVEWEPDGGLARTEPRKLTLVRTRS